MRILSILLLAVASISCGAPKKSTVVDVTKCGTGLCSDGPLYAISTITFLRSVDMTHSYGFHLDGADTGACPSSNFVSPDGTPNIDNQVANVLPVLESQIGSALPTLVQNAVNDGGIALIFEIVGDATRDGTVDLVIHRGKGGPLLGADGLMLADQTLLLAPQKPLGICKGAKISKGVLSCGPFDLDLPVQVFGVDYLASFLQTMLTMTLPTDGTDSQLLVGGAITVQNIQTIAEVAGPAAGSGLASVVQNFVPGLADIPDPVTGNCTRISGAMTMTARSVYAN
jgi:hypothetical protein